MQDNKDKNIKMLIEIISDCLKNTISSIKELILIIILVSLVFYPEKINERLRDAGFVEGSIFGFKWFVRANDALVAAQSEMEKLKEQNASLLQAMQALRSSADDAILNQKLQNLEDKSREVENSIDKIQAVINEKAKINSTIINEYVNQRARKSDYFIGLQTIGVSDEQRIKLNEKIKMNGYSLHNLTWSYSFDKRPSWFARESTVLYYSELSKSTANDVANLMTSLTNQKFSVMRGAGFGVGADIKEYTIFVHYIPR